jgi:pyrophosphate--fructose-6-phosphate 1-phosphotransferase|tara:strand:+ start:509 stop:1693 length:1185 start_codon:yes stop_codon:yes gene_type:complete
LKIAFLTAGGLAPCLSASIGALVERYNELFPSVELMGYLHGYKGLLLGNTLPFPPEIKDHNKLLYQFGGSPIGNSRVKLTNVDHCVSKGYINNGEDPLDVAADQLKEDGVDILHTIGGDDTNTMASVLAAHLEISGHDLTVVGLPKTVDNDVTPIKQTLGAWTAAEQGAVFFENIANENTTSTRQLIIHEVMGRHCGWLTAATANEYRKRLDKIGFFPELLMSRERWDLDAVYIPELDWDFQEEVERLRKRMDDKDGVNIFLSEGAGLDTIVREIEAQGKDVPRDSFGHVRLDEINPGQWFAKQFAGHLGADKVLVQKSGYFARSARPGKRDLDLIKRSAFLAVESALEKKSGVAGLDEDNDGKLGLIGFERIQGGKHFDHSAKWFQTIKDDIK